VVSAINAQTVIVIPLEHITIQEFQAIRFLVNEDVKEKSSFASRMGDHLRYVSLDTACLFAQYESVVGKNADDFFKEWVARIVEPSSSFFLLSQYFFSKKPRLFFEQWFCTAEQYAAPFWAMFWADQLWRAYIYCVLMNQKNFTEAKKAQYKLPFSFINRDWTLFSSDELRNAYLFLYTIDFRLKNGGSPVALELFYSMFFENKFKNLNKN
jgi:hypothetical protein